jgi:hypothetical protein
MLDIKIYKTWVVLIGIIHIQNFVKSSQVFEKVGVGGQTHPQPGELLSLLLGAYSGVLPKSVKTLNFGLKSHWHNGWFR